jgi:polysaccharide export outer membrane protein
MGLYRSLIYLLFLLVIFTLSSFTFSGILSASNSVTTSVHNSEFDEEYTISPGDILEITVFEVDEFNENVRVSSTGFVTLPLLGLVKVAGLTPTQLEKELATLLGQKYFRSPQVKVFVKESGWFFVGGAVREPGAFHYKIGITLTQALAQAGGIQEKSDPTFIQIVRPQEKAFAVNVKDILDGRSEDILIRRNDTVFVNYAEHYYVNGAVIRPGAFTYKSGTLLTQAIAEAGGIDTVGDPTNVKIIRIREEEGVKKKEIILVDLKETDDNPSKDIRIMAGDTIFVPKDNLKAFWRGLIGVGSVGIGKSF